MASNEYTTEKTNHSILHRQIIEDRQHKYTYTRIFIEMAKGIQHVEIHN